MLSPMIQTSPDGLNYSYDQIKIFRRHIIFTYKLIDDLTSALELICIYGCKYNIYKKFYDDATSLTISKKPVKL